MRILNLMQCTFLGGTEQANLMIVKHLLSQGHQVQMICIMPFGPGAQLYKKAGCEIKDCEDRGFFGLLSHHKLRKLVKSFPADLVIVTGPSITSCLTANIHQDIPHILWVHYPIGTSWKDQLSWRLFYLCFSRFFDKVVFCSDFIRQEAELVYPPLRRKSLTIRNIFESSAPGDNVKKSTARDRLQLPVHVPLVGTAGRLVAGKRVDIFLHVFQLIQQIIPEAHAAIAGGGDLEPEFRSLAKSLDLQDRVHWLGWLPELASFYQGLDVLIYNSDFDAFPRVPLEAMNWAVPVVASCPYGGVKEAIFHKVNGFFLEVHEVDELAAYATLLLQDENARETLGKAGQLWVQEKLSQPAIGKQIDELIKNISGC